MRTSMILLTMLWAGAAHACTTFLLERGDERVIGKSYDWDMEQGIVFANKRGVAKQALPLRPDEKPARWVSKYASVTFNQYGREMPNGGMNEAGLVVEVMWLDSGVYGPPDERPTVSELQWIQAQLDQFATINEMVAAAPKWRISPAYAKVHYLACDKSGACAAFEPLDGKLVVVERARVLTNHTHAESLSYYKGLGGRAPEGQGSLARFARVAQRQERAPSGDLVKEALATLDSVKSAQSQWHIVYDPMNLRIHFRTRSHEPLRTFSLAKLAGACGAPVEMLDMQARLKGEVGPRFVKYEESANAKLIDQSVRDIRSKLPPGTVEGLAKYPSMLSCAR